MTALAWAGMAFAGLMTLAQLGALRAAWRGTPGDDATDAGAPASAGPADGTRARMADRGSATALVAAWHAVLGTGIAELLLAPSLWREPAWAPAVGLTLVVAGVALRLSAVATLDEHFSPLVELREGHRLVTGGLYAHMRHPAYLGSACWVASLPFLLGSGVAAAVALATYVPALAWRVRVEEQVLAAAFGDAWSAYRAAVPALLPRIRAWRGPGDPPPAC